MKCYYILLLFILFSFSSKRLPKANQKVIEYIETVIGKQVGTGECSDLIFNAQYYLKHHGISSKSKSKKVLCGDFISFKNAVFRDDSGENLTLMEHYGIVYNVISKQEIVIVHQNHNDVRVVRKLKINLGELVSGTYEINHP